jgi:Rrf2 family protein
MRVSKKAEYALRAVLELALHEPSAAALRSTEIARSTGLPLKFLETVLGEVREAGLIRSKRGPDGGHWLARDPSRVTVGAVLESIDGPLSLAARASRERQSPADLSLRRLWLRLDEAIREVVDHVTLEDLRREAETRGAVDFAI